MEAQMHRPHHHGHNEAHTQHVGLHSGEGEGEHHHEKISVLKKVKAKAKKIKDSLKHGLSHEHELDHGHDHEYEEEDEDEEMVQDPEVHGASIYESAAIRCATLPQQDVGLGQKYGTNVENLTRKGEDPYDSNLADQDIVRRSAQGQGYPGQAGESMSKPTAMEAHMSEHRHMPPASGTYGTKNVQEREGNVREPGDRIGAPAGLEEDPHAPKDRPEAMQPSNYQSKVTDPTGQRGEEAGITPLVSSFGKLSVENETETRPNVESEQKSYTGSHDQFAPRPLPHKASEGSENPETTPKHFDPRKPEEMPRDLIDGKPSGQYTDKISTAASAIADKAISVKNVVASKLGYGGTEGPKSQEMHEGEHTDIKPSEQSTYTDKISSATSAIADKATAAKNVVASKLGYGGSEGTTHQGTEASTGSVKSASPIDYAHKAAVTMTETLAPVYEKVAGVGSSVMSKVQGTGTGQEGRTEIAHVSHEGKAKGTDKGESMKEYLAVKFMPGEEDKALSEMISDTLHKQKEKTRERGKAKAVVKVTKLEEVPKRLDTGEENQREGDDARIAGSESSGTGVVDKLKGAVTSWLGKGNESQTSQESPGTPFVNTKGSATG